MKTNLRERLTMYRCFIRPKVNCSPEFSFNNTLKINWAKGFLKNPTSGWLASFHIIFSPNLMVSIFLLLCNYNVEKCQLNCLNFISLLAWSMIYTHIFLLINILYGITDVLYKNKSLFFQRWSVI